MMLNQFENSRRKFLTAASVGVLGTSAVFFKNANGSESRSPKVSSNLGSESKANSQKMRLCLNFSTILKYDLPLEKELDLAYQAGFRSVEIWQRRLDDYLNRGTLNELRHWLDDHEMKVENTIGFLRCFSDDDKERADALEQMQKDMEKLAVLNCPCIAAPVLGKIDLSDQWNVIEKLGRRYRDLLLLGEKTGVRPLFELWGHLKPICRLSRSVAVVLEACHDNAALLLDAYHLYRGGNDYENLSLLSARSLPVFHANDYPGEPSFDKLKDADRVFPGDGVCPWPRLLEILRSINFNGALSLEIFNPVYQKTMSPLELVKISWQKMTDLIGS